MPHKVIVKEPEIKDKLFQELEDIIKKVAARLILEILPDSSHSRRYYLIGICESPCLNID